MKRLDHRTHLVAVAALTAPVAALGVAVALFGGLSGGQAVAACGGAAVLVGVLAWRWLGEGRAVSDYIQDLAGHRTPVRPPLRTAAGREIVSMLSHVHQHWRSETEAHSALAASYEATLDSVPDPLFALNEHRRVVGANVAARQLVQRDPIGTDIGGILRVPAVLEAVDRALARQPAEDASFVLPGPPERAFVARLRRLPVAGLNGALVVLAIHDVTAIRRSERMRADFIANASHELRTPLASLLGFIETLAGPARDDPQARERFLPIMLDMGRRMARLIEDLLSLSRIEFDEHGVPTDPVDVAAIVRSVAQVLSPQAEAKRMTIAVDVEDGLPTVFGQADQLTQVMQNLVDNAVKYGRGGTPVEISVRLNGVRSSGRPFVVVSVRDHGDGIAREHLPRLTERFYRCDPARSRELGGTGLGLAIVKHILNRHRGHLTVESTVGEGSVFTVHLPAASGAGRTSEKEW